MTETRPTVPLRLGFTAWVDEDVRRKFEAETEFANLIQSQLALTRKKHGYGTFRTEFRDQVALRQILVFEKKTYDGNWIRGRNWTVRLLITFDQKSEEFDGVLLGTRRASER